ncbi:MAG: DUF2254 domain-containing protein [Ramlibacter sp.]
MAKILMLWRRLTDQLWLRPALWSAAAVGVALMAAVANRFVDDGVLPDIERQTLEGLLSIIASSMLTVSTFSLAVLVSVSSTTASSATPRATRLVMADDSAQSAIAAFISAFIFAIIALTALGVGYYGATGRFVLLLFTVCVLAWLILALLRWINTLSRLGRMSHTLETVERAALRAMRQWHHQPALGARDGEPGNEPEGQPVHLPRTGYLQYIDVAALQKVADELKATVHLRQRPGDFVAPKTAAAVVAGGSAPDARQLKSLTDAFVVGRDRTEEQDPRFGLMVLSEIAQRALSSGVNDPGTAVQVVSALARVLMDGVRPEDDEPADAGRAREVQYPRVTCLPIQADELVHRIFEPIARDARGNLEVASALQQMLALIADHTDGALQEAARAEALAAFDHADQGLALRRERRALADIAK